MIITLISVMTIIKTANSSVGISRLDVEGVKTKFLMAGHIMDNKDSASISAGIDVLLSGPSVSGEVKSIEQCGTNNCYRLKFTPYTGIVERVSIMFGYNKNKNTGGTAFSAELAGSAGIIAGRLSVEKEPKDKSHHKNAKKKFSP
jgi:hypothetical protein